MNLLAGVLAWFLPGLGHIAIGQRRRGMLVMSGAGVLILCGLLIGGVDCVDRRNDRLWFMAQALNGPVIFGIDLIRENVTISQKIDWAKDPIGDKFTAGDEETRRALRRIGISHVNEIGTLFIALCGLMNLAVVLDAAFPIQRPAMERRRAEDPA